MGKPLMRMSSAVETNTKPINNAHQDAKTLPIPQQETTIYLTTKDAFTLTHGPSLFFVNDVEKLAKIYVQQSNIPKQVMEDISEKIQFNNRINSRIEELEKIIETIQEKEVSVGDVGGSVSSKKKHLNKWNREGGGAGNDVGHGAGRGADLRKWINEIDNLRSQMKPARLNDTFVPNTLEHCKKWAEHVNTQHVFKSEIDDKRFWEFK